MSDNKFLPANIKAKLGHRILSGEERYEEWVAQDNERRMFAPLWEALSAEGQAAWSDDSEYGYLWNPDIEAGRAGG